MVNKVMDYIRKYQMIRPGDTVVAGVSGGADSVCLLFVLMEIRQKISFSLKVVHINHGIRPEASSDADYVRDLCKRWELPFFLVEENVKEQARAHGRSEEEEGRAIRYQAFKRVLGTEQGRIAVAHNSNDRAETMLFHLFRGTGLTGMNGIRPVSGNVIRPLLCIERREIERWLGERHISFCQDATNEENTYTRNRIRHHILPCAEREICQRAVSHMAQTADQLLEAEKYICRQTDVAMTRCVQWDPSQKGRLLINLPEFFLEDEYLRGRILLNCLEQTAGSRRNITSTHVRGIQALLQEAGNRQMHLPYGLIVYKEYDLGIIQKKGAENQPAHHPPPEIFEISLPSSLVLPGTGRVDFTVFPRDYSQIIPQKTYTKWFDCDKITSVLVFRTKRAGDYLTINRHMGRKSLQDYLVNEKVPRAQREELYLLAEGSHVLWVPGFRISEYYKVDETTTSILQVSFPDKEI